MTESDIVYAASAQSFRVDKSVAGAVRELSVEQKYISLFAVRLERGIKGLAVSRGDLNSRDNYPVYLVGGRLVREGVKVSKLLVIRLPHVVVSAQVEEF